MDNGQKAILDEIKGMKRSLFGEDGMGGMAKTLNTLAITVRGDPKSPDSRGIAGDIADIKKEIPKIGTNRKLINWTWGIVSGIIILIIAAGLYILRTKASAFFIGGG